MHKELKNGTGNRAYGENSVAIGQGCQTIGDNQTILGRYPEFTGDTSTDAMVIGAGSKSEPMTAVRLKEDGTLQNFGGEVYMTSPDTGEIIPVYMTGTDNRLKKVYLSK